MKKAILFLSTILLVLAAVSCDLFDPPVSFSPPSWIIGTWSDEMGINTYTFEPDNITSRVSIISIDFLETYKDADVSEDLTTSKYEVTIMIEGVTAVYLFEKTSTTTLDYTITTNGISVGPLELNKE